MLFNMCIKRYDNGAVNTYLHKISIHWNSLWNSVLELNAHGGFLYVLYLDDYFNTAAEKII